MGVQEGNAQARTIQATTHLIYRYRRIRVCRFCCQGVSSQVHITLVQYSDGFGREGEEPGIRKCKFTVRRIIITHCSNISSTHPLCTEHNISEGVDQPNWHQLAFYWLHLDLSVCASVKSVKSVPGIRLPAKGSQVSACRSLGLVAYKSAFRGDDEVYPPLSLYFRVWGEP